MTQVVFPEAPSIRYQPEPDSRALICLDPEASEFVCDLTAEIVNESYTGCSVTMPATDRLEAGAEVTCRVGTLAATRAEVIWCRRIDDGERIEAGLQYTK